MLITTWLWPDRHQMRSSKIFAATNGQGRRRAGLRSRRTPQHPDRPTAGHTSKLTSSFEVTFWDLTDGCYFPRGNSRVFCMSLQSAARHKFCASLSMAEYLTKARYVLWLSGFWNGLVGCGSHFTLNLRRIETGLCVVSRGQSCQLCLHVAESGS
jgi:hypothetical protein